MKHHSHTPPLFAGLVIAAVFSWVVGASNASAQQSGYSKWSDPSAPSADSRLQGFVDKLNSLIDEAEKVRAADPNFLRDLRDLARGFNRPWRTNVFNDTFSDGDFNHNPAWTVTAGKYWVERSWGLRSAVKPGASATTNTEGTSQSATQEQQAAQIFGAILNQALGGKLGGNSQTSQTGQAPPAAIIHTPVAITNAFALELDLSSWAAEGQMQVAVYQGQFKDKDSAGYRLAYRPGGGFELLRLSSRGASVIERATTRHPIEDKKSHRLIWERHADGRMRISLDGGNILEATDRGFRDQFSGIALINNGGDYIIKSVSINGTN
jgi:hypothetical protein